MSLPASKVCSCSRSARALCTSGFSYVCIFTAAGLDTDSSALACMQGRPCLKADIWRLLSQAGEFANLCSSKWSNHQILSKQAALTPATQ